MLGPLARRLPRPVFYGVGGLVVAASTLIVIRLLGLSLLIGLLVVLIVLLIVVILMLIRSLQAARAAEEIETTITRQADREIERSVAGQAAELEGMKQELLAAIEALKSSKIGRRAGRSALGVLPWYMVVGPSQSGKGTLVQRSGLSFPLTDASRTPRSVRGVGGTRSLEWWLSEEAVILDMPGRLLKNTEFQDTDDWVAFLETLRNQRREKPLNGVLVAVAVDQLADRPEPEVDALARRVRERVQELVTHLGVVFPTYVVFTRCDRIAGFSEFFGDLDAGQRKQAWGAAMPTARARTENAGHLFDAEFEQLVGAVAERRLARLADVPDPVQRARVFAFPLQLERVREPMRRFVRVLFEPDPLEDGPMFRGFYLTSAAPQGTIQDRVLEPEAKALGITTRAPAAPAMAANGAWFVQDMFAKAIVPDAALAAESTRAGKRRERTRLAVYGGLGVALLAFVVLFSVLSCANGAVINRTRRAAEAVDQNVGVEAALIQNLTKLEDLRAEAYVVDSLVDGKPLWRVLGAYSGDAVRDPALALHANKTMETVVGPAVRQIESRLQRMTDTGEGQFLTHYNLFRTWRLLTDPRHLTPSDAPLVGAVVAGALHPRVEAEEPAARARYPQLVERQIAFLARHPELTARIAPPHLPPPNRDLQARAAARMRSTWDSNQFYNLMVLRARERTAPATFASLVGPPALMDGGVAVPGPFTVEGWRREMRPRINAYRSLLQRDWVIDDAFNAAGVQKPDLPGDLERAYAADYSRHWVQFLNGLSARKPADMSGAAAMLGQAAQDHSQLFKSLRAVQENTDLDVDPDTPLGAIGRDFSMVQGFFGDDASLGRRGANLLGKATSVFKKSKAPNLLDPNATPQAKVQALFKAAQAKVEQAAQAGAASGDIRALVAEDEGEANPLRQLVAYSDELASRYGGAGSAPTARVLSMFVTGARASAGGGMRGEISRSWTLRVVGPYRQTLAGKYPFSSSGPDAKIEDFKEFFRPGGTFWDFYDSELKDFVTEDGTPTSAEAASVVSPALQAALRKAFEIREAFFAGGAAEPSLKFEVRGNQPSIEGPHLPARWVALDLGGQNFSYSMGARTWGELIWPGPEPSSGATVRANVKDATAESVTREGLWGLFKLLDTGRYGVSEEGNPQVTLRLNAGHSKLSFPFEFKPGSAQHPFKAGGMRFDLPEKL